MRVALHVGQLLQPVPGGIGRYVERLVEALPGAGADVVPFAAGPPPRPLPGYRDLGRPRGRWRYETWHRFRWPRVGLDVDVVHAPSLAVPPTGSTPLVVTVHDLVVLRYPEYLTARGVRFHRRGLDLARDGAAAVIVPSAAVGAELSGEGVERERIHVAAHGVEAPDAPPDGGTARRRALGVTGPYLLFVGTIEPRKGLADLVVAHRALRAEHPDLELVVVGRPGWGEPPDLSGPGVRHLAVGDDDLDALYRGAVALALPSRYEGFGLPVVEAMARGCPVVTTDVGCLPEIAGGAAVLVAPGDTDALAAALAGIIGDDRHRRDLAAAGRQRAGDFTWAASAAAHVAAYRAAEAAS